MTYAGFWKRVAAYLVDGIIYGIISQIIGQIVGLVVGISFGLVTTIGQKEPSAMTMLWGILIVLAVQIVCYLFYYVWPESSSWQATIGKKLFGLKVTDLNGQRISFARSLGRNLAMIVSGIILCIGYLTCWSERKQCLHDLMAGCLVIDTKPNDKQGCVIGAIIGFFVLLFTVFIVGILAAIALPQYTKAVEKSRAAEAMSLLTDAKTSQEIYKMSHGRAARNWTQLSKDAAFFCTIQADPTVCSTAHFDYTLTPTDITASSKGANRYVLTMDSNGKISCKAQDGGFSEVICNSIAR